MAHQWRVQRTIRNGDASMNALAGYEWIKTCKICSEDRFVQLTESPQANFYQCEHCHVIFLNPQPTLETLKQQYTRQTLLETGPASAWFMHKRYFLRALLRERLRDVLRYRGHGDLLDVGCGMGDFCDVAREGGFTVYGTEFSDTYATHTKNAMGFKDIYVGRLQEIDFGGRQFDVISLWHVLEHLPDPLETLARLKKLLKPGGIVAIEVPNAEQKRKRPIYVSDLENYPIDRLEHLFYYSGRALQNACATAGFQMLGLRYVDAHQPARHLLKHVLRTIKRPIKQLLYMGRHHQGFSAVRIFLTV
jgi:SAM-dependent methyltransferase